MQCFFACNFIGQQWHVCFRIGLCAVVEGTKVTGNLFFFFFFFWPLAVLYCSVNIKNKKQKPEDFTSAYVVAVVVVVCC